MRKVKVDCSAKKTFKAGQILTDRNGEWNESYEGALNHVYAESIQKSGGLCPITKPD